MLFRLLLLYSIFILSLSAQGQSNSFTPKHSFIFDSSAKANLACCSRDEPKNISAFWKVSAEDVTTLEKNFKKIYQTNSTVCCTETKSARIPDLNYFAFQYQGVTINSKRYIYINAFILSTYERHLKLKKDFTKDAVVICDGGIGFWGALFDISDETFTFLAINSNG